MSAAHAVIPAALSILGQDGRFEVLIRSGARLPVKARAVFATQRASQRELAFKVYEGDEGVAGSKLVGSVDIALPAGLPPNTWLAVFFTVREDLSIAIEVKENLRRIRIDATIDREGSAAQHFV